MAQSLLFSWDAPTENVDGEALTADEIASLSFKLYESGALVAGDIGPGSPFELLMDGQPEGTKSYTMAAEMYGLEGPQSEPRVVNFKRPAAPANLKAEWVAGSESSVGGSVG